MPAPIDYLGMLPQINLGQSFGQGFQIGSTIRNIGLQRQAAEASSARAAAEEVARRKAMLTNAPEDIKNWASFDPKSFNEYSQGIERMTKDQRTQEFNAALPVFNAIQSGEITTGMKLIRQRADALRNSGQEQAADELDLLHKQIGDGQPEKALQTIRWVMNGIDPDRFSKMMEAETKLQPNVEKANQNFVKLYGRQAYSMIQRGKPLDAIASLEAKINEGMQKGYNVDALQAMKAEAEARPDGSPESIGLVLSAIDEKFGTDLKDIGEIQYKKELTEDIRQRNASYKMFGDAMAQADLDDKRAQTALSEANRDATEKRTALEAEFAPQEKAAQIRRDQVAANAQEQTSILEAQYTPVLKELEIEAARLQTDAAKRQAEIDANYKEPMAALALQKERIAAQVAQRNNEIEAEYAAKVAQAKMSQEEANARIAQEKAANAQVLEQANAQIADANARIQAEKAEVARPAEQAALALSQANAQLNQEKAAVARTVEQANAEIAQLDAAKKARENAIGAEFDQRKAEASAAQAEAERKKAEAQAEFAAQNEEISFKEKERAHEQAKKEQQLKLDKMAADLGLTKAQTAQAMVMGKKIGAETQQTLLEIAAMQKSPGGMKPEQAFNAEKDLRNEYLKRTDKYREMKRQFDGMRSSAKQASGPGDVALIMGFQKMLDPTSVVRETEFAITEQSAGRMEQLLNTLTKFKTGQRLTPEQRTSFVNLAKKYYDAAVKQEGEDRNVMGRVIKNYGLNADNVMPPAVTGTATAKPTGAIPGMPKGFKVIGKE